METVKKIAVKVCLLIISLMAANLLYKVTFWKPDLEKNGDMLLDLLNHEDTCDVLYFGESSDFTTAGTDVSKNSICGFVSEDYPSLKFGEVCRRAVHAGIYSAVVKHLSPFSKVKTVVFTLNLRSFDATWIHSRLETYLERTKIMYRQTPAVVNRFLLTMNAFENKSDEERDADMIAQWKRDTLHFPYAFPYPTVVEWDSAMSAGTYLKPDGSWDMDKIGLACHNIKNFAFQIDTLNNPRIKDFDEIVEVCKRKNLNIVFNLLSENVQYADSLVGKDLVYLIKKNRDLLVSRYTQKGVLVVDNLESVKGTDFTDQNWTTEHYNEAGRRAVAKKIAIGLKKYYPGLYINKNQVYAD